jgi:hypothetical protein
MDISPTHRKGISVALTSLDEMLCEVEAWAKGREAQGVLYRERNTLSPARREQLLKEVTHIRQLLKPLLDVLGLEGRAETAADDIWGMCAGLRAHLMELESRPLRRYGPVPRQLGELMDAQVPKFLEGLDRISRLVSQDRGHRPTRP